MAHVIKRLNRTEIRNELHNSAVHIPRRSALHCPHSLEKGHSSHINSLNFPNNPANRAAPSLRVHLTETDSIFSNSLFRFGRNCVGAVSSVHCRWFLSDYSGVGSGGVGMQHNSKSVLECGSAETLQPILGGVLHLRGERCSSILWGVSIH